MLNEDTQLEIRKFLKRLGINSQQQLQEYISNNPSLNDLKVSVSVNINDNDYFKFEDKIKLTK